jgi:Tol biopolymer transport system component
VLNRDAGGRMTLAMQKQLPGGPFRDLTGRISQLRIIDLERGTDTLQWQTDALIEAPNWAPDGSALWLNGRGAILRWRLGGGAPPEPINIGRIEDANNDHCIAPDGRSLYLSAGGAVYAVSADGGEPLQVTPEGRVQFYLHGVSPDGRWLACTTIDMGSDAGRWGVAVLPAAGGAPRPLLLSSQPLDGPEWSPDGDWIWFNGELQADAPGHSQIFRMRTDGSGVERMTRGPGVDWFPHPSPDGRHVAFLRYPSGTTGHPPDRLVEIWLMTAAGTAVTRLAAFRGGQGSFNVNGWSPDGGRIAYVAYPLAASADDDGGGEIPQRAAD